MQWTDYFFEIIYSAIMQSHNYANRKIMKLRNVFINECETGKNSHNFELFIKI